MEREEKGMSWLSRQIAVNEAIGKAMEYARRKCDNPAWDDWAWDWLQGEDDSESILKAGVAACIASEFMLGVPYKMIAEAVMYQDSDPEKAEELANTAYGMLQKEG